MIKKLNLCISVLTTSKKLKNQIKCFKECYLFAKWIKKKDEIIKTLLETQTILETVSKPSLEEEKKEEEDVSPTRNEIIEEIQWQKQTSGKRRKKSLKSYWKS